MKDDIFSFTDSGTLFDELCRVVHEAAREAVKKRGRFSLALSGGKTPRALYENLAARYRDLIDWRETIVFWGDERFVPADHEESNYRMAAEALLSRVLIPKENVFPVQTTLPTAERAAEAYDRILRLHGVNEGIPRFDLLLLGLGADGHVASLFPGSPALHETGRFAIPATAPEQFAVRERITVTFPVINSARRVVLLVTGEKKRDILERFFKRNTGIPADRVAPESGVTVFTDIRV